MMEPTINEVANELYRAIDKFPPMTSPHEGYAILKEEVDELWDEIKKQHHVRTNEAMKKEAIQVAAMAIRFVIDCCGGQQ